MRVTLGPISFTTAIKHLVYALHDILTAVEHVLRAQLQLVINMITLARFATIGTLFPIRLLVSAGR
jgi:hypothetical protein